MHGRCRSNRHRPRHEQRVGLSAVLNGHCAYYGITGNIRRIQDYRHEVTRIWHQCWSEEPEEGGSHGLAFMRFSPVAHCQWPGSFTATPA